MLPRMATMTAISPHAILVIGDDHALRVMTRALVGAGFAVQTHTSTFALSVILGGARPALVLVSFCSPEHIPWLAIAALEHPSCACVPIVVLVNDEDAEADLGASLHALQPEDTAALLGIARRYTSPIALS
jgi:hypothetical protein